jgi:hypothetical protein
MLLIPARVVGETVLPECPDCGECPDVYDKTLDAGVNAGVSLAGGADIGATTVACDDCGCDPAGIPGGEWLDR